MLLSHRKFIGVTAGVLCVLWLVSIQVVTFFSNFPEAYNDLLINQRIIAQTRSSDKQYSGVGWHRMRQSSVTLIGVGKAIPASHISSFLARVDALAGGFQQYRSILVIDGESLDARKVAESWVQQDETRRMLVSSAKGNTSSITARKGSKAPPREAQLAAARNAGLRAYREGGEATDFLIMYDLDIVGWDPGGVEDTLGQHAQWDVACAQGVMLHGLYRDVYAFRLPGVDTNHHLSGDDHRQYNISEQQRRRNKQHTKVRALNSSYRCL